MGNSESFPPDNPRSGGTEAILRGTTIEIDVMPDESKGLNNDGYSFSRPLPTEADVTSDYSDMGSTEFVTSEADKKSTIEIFKSSCSSIPQVENYHGDIF